MNAAQRIVQHLPLPQAPPPWPVLGPAAHHGLAGEVVRTIAPHTEADQAALLFSFITAYGNAVGAGPYVEADGSHHPARLFVIVVGKSSKARKGTSWSQIGRILAHGDPGWWDSRVLGGLSSGEGLVAAVADPTEGKNGEPVGGVDDKRLLVVESEYARVLTAQARDGNTLSPLSRQAWDTGNLRVMTKVAQVATGAHVSIIGHVTIAELQMKLTQTDQLNGYFNRFLVVGARRSQLLPEGGNLPLPEISRLGAATRAKLEEARRRGRLQRTPAATALWSDLYTQMDRDRPGGMLESITARSEAHTLRLSLAYALMDGGAAIDVPHLEAAWACWRYCRASAEFVFGEARGDLMQDKLLALLREAGATGMTHTEQSKALGGHRARDEITAARQALIAAGLAVEWTADTGGRPVSMNALVAKEAKEPRAGDAKKEEEAKEAPLISLHPLLSPPYTDDDAPPEYDDEPDPYDDLEPWPTPPPTRRSTP